MKLRFVSVKTCSAGQWHLGELLFDILGSAPKPTFRETASNASNIFLAVRTFVLQEKVDMVAADFNEGRWRCKSGPQQQLDNTIEETFKKAKLPVPPGHSPLRWARKGFHETGLMFAAL